MRGRPSLATSQHLGCPQKCEINEIINQYNLERALGTDEDFTQITELLHTYVHTFYP